MEKRVRHGEWFAVASDRTRTGGGALGYVSAGGNRWQKKRGVIKEERERERRRWWLARRERIVGYGCFVSLRLAAFPL